jgi:uncharacterized membrane protein YagU involved in acid resistance
MKSRALSAIFWGGLIAGTLDLTYACVWSWFKGVGPVQILQSVASGLLGAASYDGGAATAALGVAAHYFILFVAAALFYAASRKFDVLTRRAVICGLLYGGVIYVVMTQVILPLSAFPHEQQFPLASVVRNLAVHMVFVGLPIALMARRFSR